MGKYTENRPLFHTASRVAAQTGYALAQALDPDGHIVRHNSVWTATTDQFPMNVSTTTDPKDATDDLITVFAGARDANGAIPTLVAGATLDRTLVDSDNNVVARVYRNSNYPAVELFYQAEMSGVANSDGEDSGGTYQSFEIQQDGSRVMDWVAPTAVINDATGKPVAGFSGIAEAFDGTNWTVLQKVPAWALSAGSWEFVYIAGMLRFEPSVTPAKKSYSKVRFTGFKYIGNTLDKSLEDTNMKWIED